MASPRPVKQRAPAGPFLTDPSFCPHCGSILPLPGASDVVACRLCNFKLDTAGRRVLYCACVYPRVDYCACSLSHTVFEDVEEYSCKWFAERKGKRDLSSEGDGPTVSI